MPISRRAWLATAGLALAAPHLARAQDAPDVAAAKKEGKVVWYSSTPIAQANEIAQLFQAEYGIEVDLFRSGGSAILRRFMQEYSGRLVAADLLTTSDPAASRLLGSKGVFVPFKPAGFDEAPAQAKDPDGLWVAQRLNLMTIAVRTDKVVDADVPKGWMDLTDPKYKGRLVMTDPSFTSLQLIVVGTLSQKFGWDYYRKLRANDIMVVPSNQQVSENLKSGERSIGVGVLDSYIAENREAGHEILSVIPEEGVFVIPSPTAVIKGSPHPNAAKLLAAFMLSDKVQAVFPDGGGYAAVKTAPPPSGSPTLSGLNVMPVDYGEIEGNTRSIKEQFSQIFR